MRTFLTCYNLTMVLLAVVAVALMMLLNAWMWLIFAFILALMAFTTAGGYLVPLICREATETKRPSSPPPARASAPRTAAADPEAKAAPVPGPAAEAKAPEPAAASDDTPSSAIVTEKPVAASVEPAEARSAPAPAPAGTAPDDLTKINGIGKVLAQGLNDNGITTFAQIAAWGPAEVAWADNDLAKRFKGRCTRDDWVAQAKTLVKG